MQKTFKGLTAQQIVTEADGGMLVEIDRTTYSVVTHNRVELANGNWTGTVVLESSDGERIVLKA